MKKIMHTKRISPKLGGEIPISVAPPNLPEGEETVSPPKEG